MSGEDYSTGADEQMAPVDAASMNSYFRVFRYASGFDWMLFILSFIAAIGAGAALPLMNIVFGRFATTFNNFAIGDTGDDEFQAAIRTLVLYFVYLFVGKLVLTYIFTTAISIAGIRTTRNLRTSFLEQLLRQDIAFFESSDNSPTSTQVSTNGNSVTIGISEKLGLIVQGLSLFVSSFVVAFVSQWKLTLITITIVPAIVVINAVCIAIDTKVEGTITSLTSKAASMAEETFSSMRTVQAFWMQPLFIRRYSELVMGAEKKGMKKSPVYAVLFSSTWFCTYSGFALAFWQGTRFYLSGEIAEPGDVVTVVFAVVLAATSLNIIIPQMISISKAAAAAHEMFKVIDRVSEIDALSEEGLRPKECSGSLQINNVHFSYPSRPHVKVLDGLTFDIQAGKTTAIVGASGCGKSTLVGLLGRWYSPAEGTLGLDGNDIRDLNIRWLRTAIRSVQQEPTLFNGTVFDNVSAGLADELDISHDEKCRRVEEACRASYADEFVERLPEKYDTHIGENGVKLSGGQKQRIAIARSIISDPRVLLLDEATSALDPKAERIVQQALENVAKSRTTLVIAHKLSTIRNADHIVVMSRGSVVEQGTHKQLLELDGAYARLIKAQHLGDSHSKTDQDLPDDSIDRKISRVETKASQTGVKDQDTVQKLEYGLIRCLWILLTETEELRLPWLILIAACIVGGLTYPAQAIVFAKALQVFQLPRDEMQSEGNFYALMFFVIALANLVVYCVIGWFCNITAQVFMRKYRIQYYEAILRQDIDFFDNPDNAAGALASRLSSFPLQIYEVSGINLMVILVGLVNLVSSTILAIAVGWKLALVVAFAGLPILLFFGWLRVWLEIKADQLTARRFAASTALAAEAVSAVRTVASLTMERSILTRYAAALDNVLRESSLSIFHTMVWYSLSQSISLLSMALAFWYGAQLLLSGEYDTQQFYIVYVGIILSGEAAAQFFSMTQNFTKGRIAANGILSLRKQVPSISEKPDDSKDEYGFGEGGPAGMSCKEVEFAYVSRPKSKVLENFSLEIKPASFVALVGASGCGKSTLVALLERFYDPSSGTIKFNDQRLSELCPRKFRRQLALVQQEPVLYRCSIRDNVSMSLEGATDEPATEEQVIAACKAANIYDFICSLPDGLETMCGAKGTQLSGGQRQRVAIARALVREPRLLLLDEATSALDTESERVVQEALRTAQIGRTTVAVAHRLSTIRDADVIVVLHQGRIVETGTHDELLSQRGMYYQMCLGQSLDREVA